MKMKKYSFTLLLGVMLTAMLLLAACGRGDEETTSNSGDGDSEQVKLVIGTDAAFAPFEYLEGGEIVGFDVDILAAVMEEAGFDYELNNIGWDPIFPSLENGDIDVAVSAITIMDDRLETYDFSIPYFESTHMVVFNEGMDIKSAEDIKGLRIGVQVGTTGQFAAEKIVGKNDPSIFQYDTTALAFMGLENGNVDVVVTDNVVANEYVANNPDKNIEAITDDENFESEFYGFMFQKGSEHINAVNAAFDAIFNNGTYEEIYKEWFGTEPNIESLKDAAKQFE